MKKSNWTIEKVVQALYDDKPIENVNKRTVKILKSYTEMPVSERCKRSPGKSSPAGKTPGEVGTPSPSKGGGYADIDSSKVNIVLTPNGKNLRIEPKNTPTGETPGGDFLQIPRCNNQSFEQRPSSYMSL